MTWKARPEVRSVTALVVTWDSAADIERCLASLDAVEHDRLEIVVLDNASTDDTVARIEAFRRGPRRHPLELVRFPENLGFCGAMNRGIRASSADAVLFVNPDATIAPDALGIMLRVLGEHPRCGSVQPRVLRLTSDEGVPVTLDTTGHVLTRPRLLLNRGAGQEAASQGDGPGEVFGVSGALALHRREMLDDVAHGRAPQQQYLHEDLVAYFDDVDLDLRARQRGWTARYAPEAVGAHARAGASRRRRRRVRALNLSNHLLVIVGNEGVRSLARDAGPVAALWLLRLLAATVRSPIAMLLAIARLRLLPAALRRGRRDRARAVIPLAEVLERWCEPLPRGWLRDAVRRGLR